MTNKLVVIGWLGNKSAYLNVSREEALVRYARSNREDSAQFDLLILVEEFEFTDEFYCYDAWGPNNG